MPENVKTAIELLNCGKFKQSIQLFEKVLSQSNKNKVKINLTDILLHLSMAYLELGDYIKSQQTCTTLIKTYPHLEQGYTNLVICLAHLHKYDQSLSLCDERLQLDSRNWKLYFAKGYVLDRMRKFQQASENYSIAITKNLLNNPRSYMLQAASLASLDEAEAATKSIYYAQLAMQEDEARNCSGQYKFEIKNIKAGLKSYEEYVRRLKKAEGEQHITKSERENYEKQLIKIVGKSVDYRSTAFKYLRNRENEEVLCEEANHSEYRELQLKNSQAQESDFWNQLQMFDESLKLKIKEGYKFKATKDTIESEILSKSQSESKLTCEWIRQKCSIF